MNSRPPTIIRCPRMSCRDGYRALMDDQGELFKGCEVCAATGIMPVPFTELKLADGSYP